MSELLSALKQRAAASNGSAELLSFSHTEALQALNAIATRRPKIVALERLFAATPRGAALINRIKSDPTLLESEIHVLAHDSDYARVVPRGQKPPTDTIDQRGTRRVPRIKIGEKVLAVVDKARAAVVDLSTLGAQVISPTPLKPNQRVRMALNDPVATVEFEATVAWAAVHTPPSGATRYRAGLEFVAADPAGVEAFITRHKI